MALKEALISSFEFTPTFQQVKAFALLEKFLTQLDRHHAFVLKGYAGTGKTSTIAALVKVLPSYQIRVVLLAPTGRAAKVVAGYSGKKASTIHRKIYRKKSSTSIDAGFELADNPHENTLFIVDESSMISDEKSFFQQKSLLDDLVQYVQNGERCTLMFVGDSAQLPPVGFIQSPALNPAYLQSSFHLNTFFVELTEVVRQGKESGILYNATKIREDLQFENAEISYPFPQITTRGYRDIYQMTGEKLIEGLHYAYDKYSLEDVMIICRSNKSANLYNQHIRNQILFREEEITGGDMIMIVKNNYFWLQENDEKDEGFIANGDMAQVRKVSNVHEMYGFRFADINLDFNDDKDRENVRCRVLLDSLYSEAPALEMEKQKELFQSISEDYMDILDKKKRMEAIKRDPYFNALQIKFAYAITCHKAQGGQWPIVFVDQGYLNEDMLNTEFLRWLYTAITRAQQELYLVNFHKNFFEA